jgi:lipid A disaccharide synthetase
VTLELALSGVPMAIIYVGDQAQVKRWQKYKPRFIGLPNILYGNDLVAEFVGAGPQTEPFVDEIAGLLEDSAAVERQRAGFARVRAGMEKGSTDAPLVDAVDRVLANLPQRLASGT